MYGGQTANASSADNGGGGGGGDGGGSGGGGGNRPDGFGDTSSAWVLREMPKWVKNRYDAVMQLPIFITENGIHAEGDSKLDDWDMRAVYCSAFLRKMIAGINDDGTRVFGYTLWSFIDTFEFHSYSNWGVVYVDYDSGSLDRTKKASWTFFRRVMDSRVVPLVEAGSTPFPAPSGSAAFQCSILLTFTAFLFARRWQ
ncbi:myrosinase 1-like [Thrips palmi]|uniref:Myrosinase 1-like n=1 Tax=Thrips palmi TaxID=161013 RepID=A0A6P9AAI2_THRPL|nr:myrosinase 1-like [Thrips palmi]